MSDTEENAKKKRKCDLDPYEAAYSIIEVNDASYKRRIEEVLPKYKNYKAVPFSYSLGYSTVTILYPVISKIMARKKSGDSKTRIAGILLGNQNKPNIEIVDSFEIDNDPGSFYNVYGSQFLGFYSIGDISQEDVKMFSASFENISTTCKKSSLFLLKVEYSLTSSNLSATMFEVVPDVSPLYLKEKLLFAQLFNYPEREGLISKLNFEIQHDLKANKIFYIGQTFQFFWGPKARFELDVKDKKPINNIDDFKAVTPNYFEYQPIIVEQAKKNGYKEEDFSGSLLLKYENQKDKLVNILKDILIRSGLEITYNYEVYEDKVECFAMVLDMEFDGQADTIEKSQLEAASQALEMMLHDYKGVAPFICKKSSTDKHEK